MRSFSFALAVLLACSPCALAKEISTTGKALSGDEIELADGRILRLAGVKAAQPDAKEFLIAALSGKTLVLNDDHEERYRRILSSALIEGQTIEEIELREGLAFVYPGCGEADYDKLYETENTARKAKRGFWKTNVITAPRDAKILLGKYGFVEGIVTDATRIGNKAYLSLGEKSDFRIAIAAKFLRPLKKRGINVLALKGTTIHVRGHIIETPEPGIVVTDLYQLQLSE